MKVFYCDHFVLPLPQAEVSMIAAGTAEARCNLAAWPGVSVSEDGTGSGRIGLSLYDAEDTEAERFRAWRLTRERSAAVDDTHFHRVEPFAVRIALVTDF